MHQTTKEQKDKVLQLRRITDHTLLRCREALVRNGWDLTAAERWLREQHRPRFGVMDGEPR